MEIDSGCGATPRRLHKTMKTGYYYIQMQIHDCESNDVVDTVIYAHIRKQDLHLVRKFLGLSSKFPMSDQQYECVRKRQPQELSSVQTNQKQHFNLPQLVDCVKHANLEYENFPPFPTSMYAQSNPLTEVIYRSSAVKYKYYYTLSLVPYTTGCWHQISAKEQHFCETCQVHFSCRNCHIAAADHAGPNEGPQPACDQCSRFCNACHQYHYLYNSEFYQKDHECENKTCGICEDTLNNDEFSWAGCHVGCFIKCDFNKIRTIEPEFKLYWELRNLCSYIYQNKFVEEPSEVSIALAKCSDCGKQSAHIRNETLVCLNVECFSQRRQRIENEEEVSFNFFSAYMTDRNVRHEVEQHGKNRQQVRLLNNLLVSGMHTMLFDSLAHNRQQKLQLESGLKAGDWDDWNSEDNADTFITSRNKRGYNDGRGLSPPEPQSEMKRLKNLPAHDKLMCVSPFGKIGPNMEYLPPTVAEAASHGVFASIVPNNAPPPEPERNAKQNACPMMLDNNILGGNRDQPRKKRRVATRSRSSSINSYFDSANGPSASAEWPSELSLGDIEANGLTTIFD